jgi:hypothetical protein
LPPRRRKFAILGTQHALNSRARLAMRRRLLLSSCAVSAIVAVTFPADAADLMLKRVMLSSGGVGYFEYEAAVEGDAKLTLDVALDQVDDVLKSLVVHDETGSVGEVTLPGREPLTQGFADLPFDCDALGSAAKLLNALQGNEIKVQGAKPLSGRLLHVDPELAARGNGDGPVESRLRVAVLTDAGLQHFLLQDAESIAFADPDLQGKVAAALSRIATYGGESRRRLTVTTHGAKPRTVRIGYVVAAPLWKATYRLTLPSDPQAAKARLQGWAVLENFSGREWRDVELTLLSGNPVTFRQALYESYYVPRPSVPVESGSRVLPPPDAGTVGVARARKAAPEPSSAASGTLEARRDMAMAAPMAGAPAPVAAPPPPPPAQMVGAEASEGDTQIVFTLPYEVNAAAGQSLVVPLLDRELPAARTDLYQPAVSRAHPLAAIELANSGDVGLPPGVLTLYQQGAERGAAYLGDARLAAFPAGEKRLLSYATDNKVTIDRSAAETRPLVKAKIAGGVMQVSRMIRQTTTYRIKAVAQPGRLVIEHPRRPGWNLTEPDPKGVELTAAAYRVSADLGGKNEAALTVAEDQPVEESIRLTDLADDRLDALAASTELDPKLRTAMTDLAARRQAVAAQQHDLERLKERREQLVEDETRLRENLSAIGRETALRQRLLAKFTDAQTAIETVSASIAKAQDALASAERDLASYVTSLNL